MKKTQGKRQAKRIRRYRQRGGPGAPPGQIELHPDAVESSIQVTSYGPKEVVEYPDCKFEQIEEILGQRAVTWIDIVGLGSHELFQQIGELFGIHRLALSDVAHTPQRPKVESYTDHIFLVTQVPMEGGAGDTGQVSFFLGKNFVISWQEFPGRRFSAVRERLNTASRSIRRSGADYLLYSLLDAVIDAWFPSLTSIGDELDDLEELIHTRTESRVINRLHSVRRHIRNLRSMMWPLREAVHALMVGHEELIGEEVRVYLRDCYDHTFQLLDSLEIYRESCSDLRDYYSTEISNRMNEVMKVLTVIATLFIPLSFIAGVYGMNFDSGVSPLNMPELKWRWGYPAVLLLMVSVAVGQLMFFRRRGWIGSYGGESNDNPQ